MDLTEALERMDRLKISSPPKKSRHISGRNSPSMLLTRRTKVCGLGSPASLSVEPELATDCFVPMPLAPRSGGEEGWRQGERKRERERESQGSPSAFGVQAAEASLTSSAFTESFPLLLSFAPVTGSYLWHDLLLESMGGRERESMCVRAPVLSGS
eukprot:73160-Rhodomonas_salina.1